MTPSALSDGLTVICFISMILHDANLCTNADIEPEPEPGPEASPVAEPKPTAK